MTYRANAMSESASERMRAPELRALFPRLTQLRVELAFFSDARHPPANQTHILHPPAAAYFRYPCPFFGCNGEFRLDQHARKLLRESGPATTDEIACTGVRPQDRLTGKPCGTRLKFRIEASYGGLD